MKNIKIGADPELFLERDGEIISAEGMIGGSKKKPFPISKDGHCIQEDNVMVEFNIPACTNAEDFVYHINFVKAYLETLAEMKGCRLNFSASAELDNKYLNTEQAQEFGCDPDWNVYLEEENTPPEATGTLRCCGGHIHIGYDNPNEETSAKIILAMDLTVGLGSVLLDTDIKRKTMYGNAGTFRFKPYGVEYRTLSNFWIQNDELTKWAFDKTMEAVELVTSGKIDYLTEEFSQYVKRAIDSNDKQLAQSLLEKVKTNEITVTA